MVLIQFFMVLHFHANHSPSRTCLHGEVLTMQVVLHAEARCWAHLFVLCGSWFKVYVAGFIILCICEWVSLCKQFVVSLSFARLSLAPVVFRFLK